MARPLRIEYPGAVYHVTSRGNGRNDIFLNNIDRISFLSILTKTISKYNWLCHAYCLMDNHYHLLIETIDPTLSKGMRHLNGVYTQSFNRTHDQVGHVFQGRFKSILVEKETYLLELSRYIVLNPVRAGLIETPDQWQWSSYNQIINNKYTKDLLTTEWLLGQFSSNSTNARKMYRSFVLDGLTVEFHPKDHLKGQILLGSENFAKDLQDRLEGERDAKEIPKAQRLLSRPTLDKLFKPAMSKVQRNLGIIRAHLKHGYTLKDIGDYLGLHYSTVSRIVNKK